MRVYVRYLLTCILAIGLASFASSAHAFPSTCILDTFNRANETPIAGNWSLADTDTIKPNLASNQMASVAGNQNFTYWNVHTFPANQEAYAAIVNKSQTQGVLLRVQNVGASPTFYILGIRATTGAFIMYRYDGASFTQIGAGDIGSSVNGDSYGGLAVGTTISVWKRTAATGLWSQQDSVTDATYSGAGYVGWYAGGSGAVADDFGAAGCPRGSPILLGRLLDDVH